MTSFIDKMEAALDKWPKARQNLYDDLNTAIASTPYDVVWESDRVRLKHYRPVVESEYTTPLFIVYALINRETMLDLQPDRSVVQNMLDRGVDVYMLDWGYPSRKERFQDIDDHVNGYIDSAVDFIRHRHHIDKVNLMGVCMGGTFDVIYAALHPEKVKNLILTVSPTSFDTEAGLLHVWWGDKGFDVDRLVRLHGNMPGDLLNINFLMLNPARLMIDKYVGFMENMDDKNFVENFVRMEKWIFDSPDVPGETFREFIHRFYQENRLINNTLEIGGRHVDLQRVTMPVLNIYGRYDHLVPPEACNQLIHKLGSTDAENFCLDTGHIGIYVSSKSQKVFVPKICEWLKQRDGQPETSIRQSSSGKADAQHSDRHVAA